MPCCQANAGGVMRGMARQKLCALIMGSAYVISLVTEIWVMLATSFGIIGKISFGFVAN